MIELYLPFPPTVNSYYTHSRNGVFISPKGRLFRGDTAAEVLNQLGDFPPIQYRMLVEVLLSCPDRRKRDLDNYMKALLDALTRSELWEDDSLIDQLHIYRAPITSSGSTTIRIYPAGPLITELVD